MRKHLTYVALVIGLALSAAPAHAAKTAKHQTVRYALGSSQLLIEIDLGATNAGEINPADEVGSNAELVYEETGQGDPDPLGGSPADTEPLGGSPADAEYLRGTPADTFVGGADVTLPAGAEGIKITVTDEAAGAAGTPVSWKVCGIHGTFCGDGDTQVSACTNSGEGKPMYALDGVKRLAIWLRLNNSAGADACDSVVSQGTIRIDYLA